jgi:hypothetical protein
MPIFQRLRETHPYRLLLIATLAAVVLVQVVAMAMVTRSQVRKAEAHYAATAAPAASSARQKTSRDVVNVGYVVGR